METKQYFTDRSRTETAQRCKRARFLEYHFAGKGIVPTRKSLALVVGGCVHEGLAWLLQYGNDQYEIHGDVFFADPQYGKPAIENGAVEVALAAFDSFLLDSKLELDAREQNEQQAAVLTAATSTETTVDFAMELGLDAADPLVAQLSKSANQAAIYMDKYLETEQRGLIEAMVRAYARRRLRPLLEEFEVLEVEREGMWKLGEWRSHAGLIHADEDCDSYCDHFELYWMSRPDALLRERATNQLQIMSFKTTGAWDVRKARDAEHDMQGLSEGVEIEQRLGVWWEVVNMESPSSTAARATSESEIPEVIVKYLSGLDSPPRISAIRYEYLLKGERWKDKSLSAKLGIDCRSQNTPLLQPYKKTGITVGDDQYGWKYEYDDAEGKSRRLDYRTWKKTPIWEDMTIREWIDLLDSGQVQPEAGDALASQFIPPITVYRQDDDLRDWVEQVEAQETRIVQDAELVNAAEDEDEKRHLLNLHFPQTRRACEYPGTCNFVSICYGSGEMRKDPVGSGKFRERTANHPVEFVKIGGGQDAR